MYRGIGTCFEVTDELVDAALAPVRDLEETSPRERVFALLEHMASIARPKQGAPRILRVLARMAACEWIDGSLEVRVLATDGGTLIELVVNDGLSRVKMRDPLAIEVPYEEFRKPVVAKPELILPFELVGSAGAARFRLAATPQRPAEDGPLSAAATELFSASPMHTRRGSSKRPPRGVAVPPPPPRAPQRTILGVAEPPPAVIAKVVLAKRTVPAARPRSERFPPRGTTSRPPKSPRKP